MASGRGSRWSSVAVGFVEGGSLGSIRFRCFGSIITSCQLFFCTRRYRQSHNFPLNPSITAARQGKARQDTPRQKETATDILFAKTSQATARQPYKPASHISNALCLINHLLQTNNANTTHAPYSSPPASFAVCSTFRVMTALLARVIFHSSSSKGMTRSIWYLSRIATFVTSAGGMADGRGSEWWVGRTMASVRGGNCVNGG